MPNAWWSLRRRRHCPTASMHAGGTATSSPLRLCSGSGTLLLTGTVPSGMEPSLYAATVPPCCMWTLLEVCQRQYTVNCLLVLAEHLHEVGTQSCLPLVQAAIRLRRTSSCPPSCRTYGPGVSLQTATMPRSYPTLSGISALNALLRLRICTPPRSELQVLIDGTPMAVHILALSVLVCGIRMCCRIHMPFVPVY